MMRTAAAAVALLLGALLPAAVARAADTPNDLMYRKGPLGHWWLPLNHSTHGDEMDWLFNVIFWLTMVIFIIVEVVLVYFLIKYRHRADRKKAHFTHGNTRLEMAWTLAPAVILLALALMTKRVWDNYRFASWAQSPDRAQVLVVGEQFKWNVVYPGPDGKLGTYLQFPKPTDAKYRALAYEAALKRISDDLATNNPLGRVVDAKNPNDPGKDDDWSKTPGRAIILPADHPIDVVLTAKDVLHDFFLPNFRVKLDAVPGMRGHVYFIARPESQSTQAIAVDEAPADRQVWLDPDTPGVIVAGNPKRFRIPDTTTRTRPMIDTMETLTFAARRRLLAKRVTAAQIDADKQILTNEIAALKSDLKGLGITHLHVITRPWELVCEELCGAGHATMRNDVILVSKQQYQHMLNRDAPAGGTKPPTTAPTVAEANDAEMKEVSVAE